MATAQQSNITQAPFNPHEPAVWADHQQDMAQRKSELDKKRGDMLRCLDPEVATRFEARKPLYEWKVEAKFSRKNAKGKMVTTKANKQVVAQTEDDAWALFCDSEGVWPGRSNSETKITRLEKIN